MSQERSIRLPEELCARAEQWMAGRFENLEAFVIFLLQEIIKDDASQMDRAEEQIIEQRLKELGYL